MFGPGFGVGGDRPGRAKVIRCAGRAAAGGVVMGLEGVGESEEDTEPRVPCQYAPSDLAGVSDDLAGDLDKRLAEGAELHRQQRPALLEVLVGPAAVDGQKKSAPCFDAPGEGGHRHVCPIRHQRIDEQGYCIPIQDGRSYSNLVALMGLILGSDYSSIISFGHCIWCEFERFDRP